jgi:predicted PurR-regulated permease PerM
LLGGWVLHGFLALLIWAVVIAIITWPLYQRLLTLKQFQHNVTWAALGLILLIGAIFWRLWAMD